VTPWRMPSGVWAALMFLFSLIGVVVYLIACLTTRTRTGPTAGRAVPSTGNRARASSGALPRRVGTHLFRASGTTARLKDGTRRRRATAGRHRPGVGRLLLRRGPRSRDSWHRQCQALPRIRHCPCPHRRLRGLGSRIPPGVMSCVTGTDQVHRARGRRREDQRRPALMRAIASAPVAFGTPSAGGSVPISRVLSAVTCWAKGVPAVSRRRGCRMAEPDISPTRGPRWSPVGCERYEDANDQEAKRGGLLRLRVRARRMWDRVRGGSGTPGQPPRRHPWPHGAREPRSPGRVRG